MDDEKTLELVSDNPAPKPVRRGIRLGRNTYFARKFAMGDRVRKRSGSEWQGRVVGYYSTALTPRGYCVESEVHKNSVQIYPEAALELVPNA